LNYTDFLTIVLARQQAYQFLTFSSWSIYCGTWFDIEANGLLIVINVFL